MQRECTSKATPAITLPILETGSSEVMGQSSADSAEVPKIVFKTGVIHNACKSMIFAGYINGKTCHITIDTGSNISPLSGQTFDRGRQASHSTCEQLSADCNRASIPVKGNLD